MAGLRAPERDIGVARPPRWLGRSLLGFFVLLLLGFALLDRLGLAPVPPAQATVGAALALFAAVGLLSPARRPVDYFAADREMPPARGGFNGATGLAGLLVAGVAAGAFAAASEVLAAAGALLLGALLAGLLFAAGLQRSGRLTPGDYLASRFGGPVRLAAAGVTLTACLLILVTVLATGGPLVAALLGIEPRTGLILSALICVLAVLPGGLRSLAAAQGVQYVLIAAGCLGPAALLAWRATADPIAVLAAPGLTSFVPALAADGSSPAATLFSMLVMAAGVASLPQVLAPALAAPSPRSAPLTLVWAVLLATALVVSVLVLAQVLMIVGAPAEELGANFLGADGPLLAPLPPVLAGLLTAAVLAALLAAGQAALFGAAAALAHDIWAGLIDPRAQAGRRIFVARVSIAALGWLAASFVSGDPTTGPALLGWAFAFAAAGLFVPLTFGLWWRRCSDRGALFGTLAGFVVVALAFVSDLGGWSDAAEGAAGFGANAAAAVGMFTASITSVAVSLLMPAGGAPAAAPRLAGGNQVPEPS